MALYAISDVHGCFDLFEQVLKEANFDSRNDQLVVVGDLIDRGEDSRKVIELCIDLQKKGAIILKGNHEQMAVSCLCPEERKIIKINDWLKFCGGNEFISNYFVNNSFDSCLYEHLMWLKQLPIFIQLFGYTFVHAGLESNVALNQQNNNIMLWGSSASPLEWDGPALIVGHTPVQRLKHQCTDPIVTENVAVIDSGSFFSGILTLVKLPTDKPDLSQLKFFQAIKGQEKTHSNCLQLSH